MSGKASSPTTKTKKGRLAEKELPIDLENISSNPTFEQGVKLFEQEMYVEAIEVFTVYAAQGELFARQYLARCYYRLEKYDSAYRHFSLLANSGDEKMKDYSVSMMATIEEIRGDINKAITMLKNLPASPRNISNLALMYWRKYKITKEEFSIMESLRLLSQIDLDSVDILCRERFIHQKALIYQARGDYKIAETLYFRALDIASSEVNYGNILTDYASLLIEKGDLEHAENTLTEAYRKIHGNSEFYEAINNKWFGVLYILKNEYPLAKTYLEKAVTILKDKSLLQDLAGIIFYLSDLSKNDDFYEAAQYFANGLAIEQLSEEVKNRDEKVIDFVLNSFFNHFGNLTYLG